MLYKDHVSTGYFRMKPVQIWTVSYSLFIGTRQIQIVHISYPTRFARFLDSNNVVVGDIEGNLVGMPQPMGMSRKEGFSLAEFFLYSNSDNRDQEGSWQNSGIAL